MTTVVICPEALLNYLFDHFAISPENNIKFGISFKS